MLPIWHPLSRHCLGKRELMSSEFDRRTSMVDPGPWHRALNLLSTEETGMRLFQQLTFTKYIYSVTNPTIARSYWWWGVTLIKWHNWSFIILGHFNPNSCNSLVPLSPSSFFPTSAHSSSPSLHLNNKSVLWLCFLRSFADRSRFLR